MQSSPPSVASSLAETRALPCAGICLPAMHLPSRMGVRAPQDAPPTNKYLLEGALSGGPNNGAAVLGPATWDQSSCECAPPPAHACPAAALYDFECERAAGWRVSRTGGQPASVLLACCSQCGWVHVPPAGPWRPLGRRL